MVSNGLAIHKSAVISECGLYRYELGRSWDDGLPTLVLGMLNPSKADAMLDDHTIRKGIGFGVRLGCGSLVVWNAYAYRATKPADLWKADDPVGPENDQHIEEILNAADEHDVFVVGWGAHAKPDRVADLRSLMHAFGVEPKCWGMTNRGAPRHPLMLAYDTPLRYWD